MVPGTEFTEPGTFSVSIRYRLLTFSVPVRYRVYSVPVPTFGDFRYRSVPSSSVDEEDSSKILRKCPN
ncbi:hypothetical protein HanRHA438_Chr00c22g0853261 [Helianthus annuus]|nr:hypothetical protein HanRHA438_Chr00c22g0853261 [Helianthus annuus]